MSLIHVVLSLFFLQSLFLSTTTSTPLSLSSSTIAALLSSKLGLPYKLSPDISQLYARSTPDEFFKKDLGTLVVMLPGVTEINSTWQFPRTEILKNKETLLPSLSQPEPNHLHTANVLDILQQVEKSMPLTLIHAFNWQTANKLNVHPDIYAPNKFGIYWYGDHRRGSFSQLDIQWSLDLLSSVDVWSIVSESSSLSGLFPAFSGKFNFFSDHLLTLETSVGSATFDLNVESNFAFFAEILSAMSTIKILTDQSRSYSSLTRDKFPDAYIIVIENLQKIEGSQRDVALEFVRGMIESAMNHLSEIYKQRASGLVILTPMYDGTSTTEETWDQYQKFRTRRTFYAEPQPSNETIYEDAGIFQICLWSTVALIIVVLSIIYLLATIDVGKDTLLYRNSLDVQMSQQNIHYE
eukprot:TRINITY_DN101_c0_g1_i1.p1 TRINITY_DN101_c0_g1~~TRINITY_DN101_c0_g1_i1.p1  ORF type:complete len:409 (-),score=85.74 TRINITY_DN101_c0_g1_i1:31-1257(-)